MSGSALPSSFCRGCKIHFIFRPACLLPVYHRLSTSRLGLASYVANPGSVTQRLPGRDLHPLVKYSMRCRFRQRWHTNGTFSVRTHNILNIYLATVPFIVPFIFIVQAYRSSRTSEPSGNAQTLGFKEQKPVTFPCKYRRRF
jgi:hypothetical protein